jgi:hypothetical protein
MGDNRYQQPGINISINGGDLAGITVVIGAFLTLWLGMGWI